MACDTPKPCKFLPLDSCQKRFLWTRKGDELAPHPVTGHAPLLILKIRLKSTSLRLCCSASACGPVMEATVQVFLADYVISDLLTG